MMRTVTPCSVWSLILAAVISSNVQAAVVLVPQQYATIQAGLDAASAGDSVLVAEGTYSGTGNVNLDFHGKAVTLVSESGPESCIIVTNGDEYGVAFYSGETSNSVCESITFKSATGPVSISPAAAIYCVNASPSIRWCHFERPASSSCSTTAFYLENSNSQISHCTIKDVLQSLLGSFTGIYASNSSLTLHACSITCTSGISGDHGLELIDSEAVISDCTIQNCRIQAGIFVATGGGAILSQNSEITMSNCVVQSCQAPLGGGLMIQNGTAVLRQTQFISNSAASGAAVGIENGEVLIEECVIRNNTLVSSIGVTEPGGSGVYSYGSSHLTIRRSELRDNSPGDASSNLVRLGTGVYSTAPYLVIEDSTFSNNQADIISGVSSNGGAVYCHTGTIVRTDFTNNYATYGGAIYKQLDDGALTIADCVFTANQATFGGALVTADNNIDLEDCDFSGNSASVASHILALTESAAITIAACSFTGCANEYYFNPLRVFEFETTAFEWDPINQDVYIAPTGDDTNSGLDSEHPFRTLTHALRSIVGTVDKPIEIHLGPGRYNATDADEQFPLAFPSYVTITGAGMGETLLSGEFHHPVGISYSATESKLQMLTIMNSASVQWGAFNCISSEPTIDRCLITGSRWQVSGAPSYSGNWALYCLDSAPLLTKCVFSDNTMDIVYHSERAGGAIGCFGESAPLLSDCLIAANSSYDGGGLYCEATSSPVIVDCVFYANSCDNSGAALFTRGAASAAITNTLFIRHEESKKGVFLNNAAIITGCTFDTTNLHCASSAITVLDSILWSDLDNFKALSMAPVQHPAISYCDIKGGYEGEGNFERDPLFTAGPWGSYYLSAEIAGQSSTSPCINAGSQDATGACYQRPEGRVCYSSLTTLTNHDLDLGRLNLGYHYWPIQAPAITTELDLPQNVYKPGDQFVLTLILTNNTEERLEALPFAVALYAYGHYYCYPTWNEGFQLVLLDLEPGITRKVLFDFTWPEIQFSADAIEFFAAPLYRDMSGLVCEPGYVEFGWEP